MTYIINLPLYALTRITPRRTNLWVFGSWLGRSYSDNARYYFEYVCANHPEVEAVWLTNSPAVLAEVRSSGRKCEMSGSLRGYWVSARAAIAIVTTGRRDVNRYVVPPRVVNLWHGIPLKKIEHDSSRVSERLVRQNRVARFFPFHTDAAYQLIASSSAWEASRLASAFRVASSAVRVTGAPRNDALLEELALPRNPGRCRVLYAPTFRDHDVEGPVRILRENLDMIERMLGELDMELHVRLHPNAPDPGMSSRPRLRFDSLLCTGSDLPKLMADVDLLVTDYSSLYLDFLLTDRPIMFLAYDLLDYLSNERELYFEYGDPLVTPGPICRTWEDVVENISSIRLGADSFAADRAFSRSFFHRYSDAGNCLRVFEAMTSGGSVDCEGQ
ncbi:CDP-glycerol glycerophosphotransferase family protein [Nocardioides sp. zg-536]|uniref:CDP-glycerol glycerophosphotransferase family protein n=1 Tax=Nocardioides faecalis TaxID=2803858 RepID=A0A938Y5R5_9ACTN|nr:CDP-glycerol glycerophosphotransferase family protein [Nocardioides faecalis]MBM9458385.1 CDP-glycerol glycerophosphotransferase family protein [Nocardioides faecalis]